jgi:two-component system chemotaxis response regulator CheB
MGQDIRAVVIGASAGAVQALSILLPALPRSFPVPILVVVHVPADRRSMLAELFDARCQMAVREAEDKEPALPGTVYFAPSDYHMLVEADGAIALSSDEAVMHSRPSINVLFETAADAFGPGLIGLVLSGANTDGALGLRAIEDAGGIALVQSPASAYSRTMPEAAIQACRHPRIVPIDDIATCLMKACSHDH